jgi:hypothetical protein
MKASVEMSEPPAALSSRPTPYPACLPDRAKGARPLQDAGMTSAGLAMV